jgi:ABC-type branched-subunit amino acid transport system substrate-binding protein
MVAADPATNYFFARSVQDGTEGRTAMRTRLHGWAKAFAAAALLCWSGAVRADEPAPVVLGAIYNLTGSQAGLDIPSSRGAQLAVDEVNRGGGVLGRPVRLVLEDGESRPEVSPPRPPPLSPITRR